MLQKLFGSDSVSSAYSLLSERGILSGFYIGTFGFVAILGNSISAIDPGLYGWLAVICFVLGLIIGHISYEAVLPLYRLMTDRVERKNLIRTANGDAKEKFPSHAEVRIFRESFIADPANPDNIKRRIIHGMDIRIALSYLNSASIVGFLILFIAYRFSVHPSVINLEVLVNSYVFIMSLIGKFPRTAAIGRDVGIAYLYTLKTKQASKAGNSEHAVEVKT